MSGAPAPAPGGSAVRQGLFFLVGHHRGGTTLLQSMLSSHSRLTIPPETQFFLEVWPRRARLGELGDAAGRRRALAFLSSADCSARDLGLGPEEVAAALAAGAGAAPDYADLFVALLAAWARRRGKARVGEKSPGHIGCVPLLAELFPVARFIACLRDPRAVVSSELRAEWGARSAHQIARRWNRVVDAHEALADRLPAERYRMLRYEDLVGRPEAALRAVCEFLGESFEPAMLRYFERPAAERGFDASERWKYGTLGPLDPVRMRAWESELPASQLEIVERVAGARLEGLGYAPARAGRSGSARYAWRRLRDRAPWALEVLSGAVLRKRGPRRSRALERGRE